MELLSEKVGASQFGEEYGRIREEVNQKRLKRKVDQATMAIVGK